MFEYQQNAAYCEGTSLCTVFNAHVGPPLLTSLGATLQCSDGNSLKADLHWEEPHLHLVVFLYLPPSICLASIQPVTRVHKIKL